MSSSPPSDRFAWHPTYQGRTVQEVRAELEANLVHDQRAYTLALERADEQENVALAAILDLDKRWGGFDLGWTEADPAELVARIVAFERERERRRELIPFERYRAETAQAPATVTARVSRPWWAFWRSRE